MIKLKFQLILFTFLGFNLNTLFGQESFPSSGGKALGLGGKVSYTIGQVFYTFHSGTSGTINQGVQQPFDISDITNINNELNIDLKLSVYPNPTKNDIKLICYDNRFADFKYRIYSIDGSLIRISRLKDKETLIDFNNQNYGTYFLKVYQENKEIKTYKIIKY